MEAINQWMQVNATLVYALLFGYCALKSGALPLFAGVLVHGGGLDLWPVVAASFLGAYLGDELRFAVARRYGAAVLGRWDRSRRWLAVGRQLLERYGAAYIFLYRYPKGMRTIGALPVGLSSMRWTRFTALNAASAGVWAGILVGVGYAFGASITQLVETNWGWVTVTMLALFLTVGWFAVRRLAPAAERAAKMSDGQVMEPLPERLWHAQSTGKNSESLSATRSEGTLRA